MKFHQGPVFFDSLVNLIVVEVHFKTNFGKVAHNQLFRIPWMLLHDRQVTYHGIDTTLGIKGLHWHIHSLEKSIQRRFKIPRYFIFDFPLALLSELNIFYIDLRKFHFIANNIGTLYLYSRKVGSQEYFFSSTLSYSIKCDVHRRAWRWRQLSERLFSSLGKNQLLFRLAFVCFSRAEKQPCTSDFFSSPYQRSDWK